ncbi:hypothetical protein N7478_002609 [Penicillium angulare]|uniref:uncharacterized protein n=1 Tax=Penicillium angulare TaxID=116970 RepID=UPI0025407B8E|nr:uncharacterized protein N7478_002609 [Penicillium angulare]KAJ5286923.1 hypothetical protein N7478_002609 [Penicillium angulare]
MTFDNEKTLPLRDDPLTFPRFLTSPVVEIEVGEGDGQMILTAHQTLLLESPFLKQLVDEFDESGPRRIKLPTENVEAFSCFLEFQYTHDYTVAQSEGPEPSNINDDSGEQLLKHARIYTLAEKLGMPGLKSLAHKKIHTLNGTPLGELSYARYVYTHTRADDTTIRKPVASYWASRGHVLRHDLTEKFKTLCTEVPEFTYDVLSIILDRKKTGQADIESGVRGSARKRLRSEK